MCNPSINFWMPESIFMNTNIMHQSQTFTFYLPIFMKLGMYIMPSVAITMVYLTNPLVSSTNTITSQNLYQILNLKLKESGQLVLPEHLVSILDVVIGLWVSRATNTEDLLHSRESCVTKQEVFSWTQVAEMKLCKVKLSISQPKSNYKIVFFLVCHFTMLSVGKLYSVKL
jgi:hypothetical protein